MPFSFVKHCLILLALTISVSHANAKESILSPDGQLAVTFSLDEGTPEYSVSMQDKVLIRPSALGFQFKNQPELASNLNFVA